MKTRNIIAILLCAFSTISFSQTLKLKQSSVHWDASALGNFSNHSGTMNKISGFITKTGHNLTGKLDINTASFTVTSATGNTKTKLEKILKEDGFLEVHKYPNATMEILSAKCIDDQKNKYEITAKITVKNKSKISSFPATVTVGKDYLKIATEPLKVNRVDYNLKLKSLLENAMVKDLFKVSFELLFNNNITTI